MRVLTVSGDTTLSRALCSIIRTMGAVCEQADQLDDAIDLARHYDFDLVVVDAMSGGDGCDGLRRMRAHRITTPVLLLTADWKSDFRVRALNAGADDVMQKPFESSELVARIRAVVRRSKGWASQTIAVGNIRLNLDIKKAFVGDAPVHLTAKEYAVLELLMLRKGMILTKEAFLNHLYGGMDEPEMKIIDVFICKLRKKLAAAGAAEVIGTVWGRGYTVEEARRFETTVDASRPLPLGAMPKSVAA